MICCLNAHCQKPLNPDNAQKCRSCGAPLVHALRGHYKPIRLLGQGGFGRTYLAEDKDRLNAKCVVKQFSPQVRSSTAMHKAVRLFNQEAMRLHELGEHPQIPTLLAYFEQENYLYLVQQYIEGHSLAQELVRNGPLNEAQIRLILLDLLPLLQFVHDNQIIHRDITPTNILRRKSDGRMVLIDFGVAKQLNMQVPTQPGTRIGTEGYSPMEQFRGGQAYPASDIYSLAATCLHLLTNTRPDYLYDPLNGQWIWQKNLEEQNRPISSGLTTILDKMLQDLVNERYQAASDVLLDVQRLPTLPPSPPPAAQWNQSGSGPPTSSRSQSSSRPTSSRPTSSRPTSSRSTSSRPTSSHPTSSQARSGPRSRPSGSRRIPPSNPASAPLTSPPPTEQLPQFPSFRSASGQGGSSSRPPLPPSAPPSSPNRSGRRISSRPSGQNKGPSSGKCHCLYTLSAHSSWVTGLTISPTSDTFASSGLDDQIKMWNLQTGDLLFNLKGHTRGVNAISFSPNGQFLVSGSDDYSVKVWNARVGNLMRTLLGHSRDVTTVVASRDGSRIVSGGADRAIRIWELRSGKLLKAPFGVASIVRSLATSPDGRVLVSGGLDRKVKLWSMQTAELAREWTAHRAAVTAVTVSANSQMIGSAGKDQVIKLWDLHTGKVIREFKGHKREVNAIAITPNNQFVISGSSDASIRIWDTATGKTVTILDDHADSVNAIAVHRHGRYFISGSSDRSVKVWQFE